MVILKDKIIEKRRGLVAKFIEDNRNGLDILYSGSRETQLIFQYIVTKCEDQVYRASKNKDEAYLLLNITDHTYYKSLKELVELDLLLEYDSLDFTLNNKYFEVTNDIEGYEI